MELWIILLWIAATFAIGSLSGFLGKKYGVEFPMALMAALVVMANVFANKIVVFANFTVPAGVIVFSMTFFITDILSERFGKKYAKRAVWLGFFVNLVFIIFLYIVTSWDPAPFATEISDILSKALSQTPRIIIASLIAYVISQNNDVWMFHLLKKLTKDKHLWLRNNVSTISSQFIDSVIFITLAFYGVFPILPLIFGQWIVKIVIAIIDTPFIYLSVWMIDKTKNNK